MPGADDLIGIADCEKLLGLPRRHLRGPGLADLAKAASGRDGRGRPLWKPDDLYRWAADNMPGLAPVIPLHHWPRPAEPAAYLGARQLGSAAVAQLWENDLGHVCVAWDYPADKDKTLAAALARFPHAGAIAVVGGDFDAEGPTVWAVLPGRPDQPRYESGWHGLSNMLGRPAPFWPFPLRIPDLIRTWKPGNPPAVAAAIPRIDLDAPLRLAALAEQGSPAQRVLVNLVRSVQSKSTGDAELDLKIAREAARRGTLEVAAVPLEVPGTSLDDLGESVRRAGWLEILGRGDHLAALCVRRKLEWDGGADFPSGQSEEIDPETPHGREWARRLVPAPRTAQAEVLDPGQEAAEILTDPETDAPVIRKEGGTLLAAAPHRLPTTSPLKELILDYPIWIRTEDGTLYLAPQHHYFGIGWGYGGSGPGSLALLIDRLLDDIAAPAADDINGAAPGLEELTQVKWPQGTVLTRADLEEARRGNPPGLRPE